MRFLRLSDQSQKPVESVVVSFFLLLWDCEIVLDLIGVWGKYTQDYEGCDAVGQREELA